MKTTGSWSPTTTAPSPNSPGRAGPPARSVATRVTSSWRSLPNVASPSPSSGASPWSASANTMRRTAKICQEKRASPSLSTKYSALVELLPEVETALSKKGESVKRSVYDGLSVKDNRDSDEDEADDVGKKNFEATSDEDAD